VGKRLYRSRTDRMLAGVAGGMADYFDLDPSVVRVVWALLVVALGAGILLYIVAAIVIPEEPMGAPAVGDTMASDASGSTSGAMGGPAPYPRSGRGGHRESSGAIVFGVVLVVAGAWFLLRQYIPTLDDRFVWPSVLVVIGIFLIAGAMRRR
jgi:phage shock protein C